MTNYYFWSPAGDYPEEEIYIHFPQGEVVINENGFYRVYENNELIMQGGFYGD